MYMKSNFIFELGPNVFEFEKKPKFGILKCEYGTFNGKNESLVTWHCHVWASIQLLGLYLTLCRQWY